MTEIDKGGIEQCSDPSSGMDEQYCRIALASQNLLHVGDCCHFVTALAAVTAIAAVAVAAVPAMAAAVAAIAAVELFLLNFSHRAL